MERKDTKATDGGEGLLETVHFYVQDVSWAVDRHYSVTRFGEILPLWQNFEIVGQIF